MEKAMLIGIDWGTSAFRAYRIDAAGAVRERLSSSCGIRSVIDNNFGETLRNQIGAWMDAENPVPVVMSGMIGSRQGWQEAPYCPMPASLDDIAGKLVHVGQDRAAQLFIVPGVVSGDAAMPDVMRGEETQIFGALRQSGERSGTFVLPGTHSKWAFVDGDRIHRFATYMTGEIFAALRGHTILGSLMGEGSELHGEGFKRGLEDGAQSGTPGALLHRLFGARTHALFGYIEKDAVGDYLSGLLIGAEFADATTRSGEDLAVVGASALADRYLMAAEYFGLAAKRVDPECTASGLHAIAVKAGLLRAGEEKD